MWATEELAPGHLLRCSEISRLRRNLPQVAVATDIEVMTLIADQQLFGLGSDTSTRTCSLRHCSHPVLACGRDRRLAPGRTGADRETYFMMGMENSAPSLMPEGQRWVTVLTLV